MSKAKCLSCEDILEFKDNQSIACSCGQSFLSNKDNEIIAGGNIAVWKDGDFMAAVPIDETTKEMLDNMNSSDEEFDGIDDYNNQQWNNIDEPYYYLSEQELDELTANVRQEEEERIIKLLEQHKQTTNSVSGFLGVCSCGEAIDDYNEHLQKLIKEELNG